MAKIVGTSRAVLLCLLPLTIPVVFLTLRVPFGLLLGATLGAVLPSQTVHMASVAITLVCTLGLHLQMWRATKPSQATAQADTAPEPSKVSAKAIWTLVAVTAAYWCWESYAYGNIRVDLLLIYPMLIACYLVVLWPRFRLWSILIAAGLMAVNLGYFVLSYDLFGKNRG